MRHVAVAIIHSPSTGRILMITSRKHPHLWILPKGGVEKGETAGQAAVRESWEEAGTPQTLLAPKDEDELLVLSLEPSKSQKRASVWHVHVVSVSEDEVERTSTWPEAHERKRAWYTPSEAIQRINEWYTDSSAKSDLEGETQELGRKEYELESKGRGKNDIKGGAMEMALRRFMELNR